MRRIWVFFAVCSLLFIIIEVFIATGLGVPIWLKYYFKDFLCMPVVLGVCLMVVQWLKKDRNLKLEIPPIFVLTILYSFYFELILPQFMRRYTGDFLDVIMYFLGAFVFYVLQTVGLKKKKAA